MRIFYLILFFGLSLKVYGQKDTLSLTLADAENAFLAKNFQLLAVKYGVSASEAAIVQAKLYPNPNVYFEKGAYNTQTGKWFDWGEASGSVQQIIILARKRNKQIQVAKINAQIAKYQFFDLIRTLRYELRSNFYGLYFSRQSIGVYDRELESLKSLINAYNEQYKKGNVSFLELARIQAEEFNLQNERMNELKDAAEKQANLSLLMGDSSARPIKPVLDTSFLRRADISKFSYNQLLDSGKANRYDLQAAKANVDLSHENLSLQRSLAVPDLTLQGAWDRVGNAYLNYTGVGLGVDLPLWNRNQGNIKIAKYQIDQGNLLYSQADLQVRLDISKAYEQLSDNVQLYKTASGRVTSDYGKLLEGINLAYQKRTISLLEFIDYYETYKNTKTEYNKLQNSLLDALENLNLATGSVLIK